MAILLNEHPATGGPGIDPRWTRSDKDGVGTAYSVSSRVWFTISKGILNEIYYPTIDRPQVRDLQYLITDGETFFRDERHLHNTYECVAPEVLGYRITNADPKHGYRIIKEIIAAPHHDCVLIHTRLEADPAVRSKLRLFALLAPHLEVGGRNNYGNVARTDWGGDILTAHKGGTWCVLIASSRFLRCSCGYVGATDGWQDLARDFRMDWEFASASDGNIALTGEIDTRQTSEFVLALAFGDSLHQALVTSAQALGIPFADQRERFITQWQRVEAHRSVKGESVTGDGGRLYRISHRLILAHEDKAFDGAIIASLSIPWGEFMSGNPGGYHLVWTRDMCQAMGGLLAAGHTEVPLRALIYLACAQQPDGGFCQNFWINGEPYWHGIQLDETAFPIILAWQLRRARALLDFDPYPMVLMAANYLITHGPATAQERWEENSGYSPSTLAVQIAALVCAACFARERGETATAQYLEETADFLVAHLEPWTVTTEGTLVPGIRRHFIRIHPVDMNDPEPDEDANHGLLELRNQPPGDPTSYPAKEIVDAGFLELVRYGIRRPDDPVIEDSLRVVDAVLKVDTPVGPCWRRYNHDCYGQRADGGPFLGWGKGHAWPLLTGERGHYELAAGRDVCPYLRTMEGFATSLGLLPEQVWSDPDRPHKHMRFGRPTGGAMPLVWAHSEYLKLVRSAADGQVFDLIPEVADRYRNGRVGPPLEIWKLHRQVRCLHAGGILRVQAQAPFRLRWTANDWEQVNDIGSTPTGTGADFADITVPPGQRGPLCFTFFWTKTGNWEGRNFEVRIEPGGGAASAEPSRSPVSKHEGQYR